jgi:opacity protein-like surface antigen
MPAFTQILPNVPINIPIDLPQFSAMVDGSTWVGTMGVRYEPTVQTARFRPYVSGGLGINHTEQRYLLEASSILPELGDAVSHNGIAFSAGGGANIHLAGVLWVNADAKYFRLSRDRNVIRFGGGATVKF